MGKAKAGIDKLAARRNEQRTSKIVHAAAHTTTEQANAGVLAAPIPAPYLRLARGKLCRSAYRAADDGYKVSGRSGREVLWPADAK